MFFTDKFSRRAFRSERSLFFFVENYSSNFIASSTQFILHSRTDSRIVANNEIISIKRTIVELSAFLRSFLVLEYSLFRRYLIDVLSTTL